MQVAFLNLPTTDLFSAPNQQRLEEGVAWMIDETSSGKGSVYVHCKAGRARSATLVAAYLMQVLAPSYCMPFTHCMQVNGIGVEDAVAVIREARPHILLQGKHFDALQNFHAQLKSSSKTQ